MSSLSLANAVHPVGTPWILPRLDPGTLPVLPASWLAEHTLYVTLGKCSASLNFSGREGLRSGVTWGVSHQGRAHGSQGLARGIREGLVG